MNTNLSLVRDDETISSVDQSVFVHERIAGVDVLRVYGEVDVSSVSAFENALRNASRLDGQVVVDLQPCSFIDSSVLTSLIRAERTYQGRFGIILPESGPVRRVFTITQLTEYLPIVAAI